ncbi:MAG: DUF4390 domain-containing protein [Acidobacteriota bacterium]
MVWKFLSPAILLFAAFGAMAQTESVPAEPEKPKAELDTAKSDRDPRITGVKIDFEDQHMLLSFKLLDAFDDSIRKRIDSGLPTSFTYELQLIRGRKTWFDRAVDYGTLRVGAMYNAVRREYLINFEHDGNLIESKVVKDATELVAAMTEFSSFPAFELEGKKRHHRLRVRVRAELRTKTIFFFIPSTVHTDWAETRRFRLNEELE